MSESNIWNWLSPEKASKNSAYDYLMRQKDNLSQSTKGELKMEVEAVDAYLETDPTELVALYKLYVVAPKLGHYRRKILTVQEGNEAGEERFPVDVFSHVDEYRIDGVKEQEFDQKIREVLTRSSVKKTIENLLLQSMSIK